MLLFLKRPTRQKLFQLIEGFESERLEYDMQRSTLDWQSSSFRLNPDAQIKAGDLVQMRRTNVGWGRATYLKAISAIKAARSFDLGWIECFKCRDFETGDTFCLLARSLGIWSANFCRIVYEHESETPIEMEYSIGIGTLSSHAAKGEERLSIVWNRKTDQVDFLIGSFSRPRTFLARVMARYLRRQQARFAIEAAARLKLELANCLAQNEEPVVSAGNATN